jgi:hypothetical protein
VSAPPSVCAHACCLSVTPNQPFVFKGPFCGALGTCGLRSHSCERPWSVRSPLQVTDMFNPAGGEAFYWITGQQSWAT